MQTIPTSRKNPPSYLTSGLSFNPHFPSFAKTGFPWDSINSVVNYRELLNINCAYHPKEKITNFCKDSDCLLPLCPKCIKIHTE